MDVGLGSFGSDISIHAPRTGSDAAPQHRYLFLTKFQSTLPARGATSGGNSDETEEPIFQSTLPARGATYVLVSWMLFRKISIHAPRTGSDFTFAPSPPIGYNFNPRSPHGERPAVRATAVLPRGFQSTLPARGATALHDLDVIMTDFNPRSPHGERQASLMLADSFDKNFNPRSPHGEPHPRISCHAPLA